MEQKVIEMDKIQRWASKIYHLLIRRTPSPIEGYAVLRFLVVMFEVVYGFPRDSLPDAELRPLVEKLFRDVDKEPS
jgi:hypothetical protein